MTKDKRERLMCLIKSWLRFGPNRRAAQPEPCGTRRCRNPSELCQGQFDLRASRSANYRNHHGGAVNQSAVQGFGFQAQLRLTCRLWGFWVTVLGRNVPAFWDQEKGTKATNICCALSLQRKRAEREKAPRLQPDE